MNMDNKHVPPAQKPPIGYVHISPADAPAWHDIIESIRTAKQDSNGRFQNWRNMLDQRQEKELGFAALYAQQFNHGTTGHNQLLLIARLGNIIDFILDNYMLVPKD